MAYTLDYSLTLGPAYSGLADLRAILVDTTGGAVGSVISTGFTQIYGGFYLWHYALFPDDHRGGVKFWSAATSGVILAFNAINPQEAEYSDVKTSTRAISGALLASGSVVSVFSGCLSGQLVTADRALLSGVVINSGAFVTVPSGGVFLASGQQTLPYSGSLSVNSFSSGTLDAYLPDKVLSRDYTALSGVIASGLSGRCLLNATRKLINAFDTTSVSGFLSIYQEDDTSLAFQQALTSTSGAAPITSLNTR